MLQVFTIWCLHPGIELQDNHSPKSDAKIINLWNLLGCCESAGKLANNGWECWVICLFQNNVNKMQSAVGYLSVYSVYVCVAQNRTNRTYAHLYTKIESSLHSIVEHFTIKFHEIPTLVAAQAQEGSAASTPLLLPRHLGPGENILRIAMKWGSYCVAWWSWCLRHWGIIIPFFQFGDRRFTNYGWDAHILQMFGLRTSHVGSTQAWPMSKWLWRCCIQQLQGA